jgi:hypothetical protein
LPNPSSRARRWGLLSFQHKLVPDTEKNSMGVIARSVSEADKPHRRLIADCLDSVGPLTSHNPICLEGLLQE